jgi:hypothetical protein
MVQNATAVMIQSCRIVVTAVIFLVKEILQNLVVVQIHMMSMMQWWTADMRDAFRIILMTEL